MPPMPYVVTQGDINTALENAFNYGFLANGRTPKQVRLDTLRDLLNGKPIGECGTILEDSIASHIETHWFGKNPTGKTWWVHWDGPAEEVARRGMIAGLAISLGLQPDVDMADLDKAVANGSIVREDWVDFSWICPVPRFEFWISWREIPDGLRAVNITMATPGPGEYEPPEDLPPILSHAGGELKNTLSSNYEIALPRNGHIVVGSSSSTTTDTAIKLGLELGIASYSWEVTFAPTTESKGPTVIHQPTPIDGIANDAIPDPDALRPENRPTQP